MIPLIDMPVAHGNAPAVSTALSSTSLTTDTTLTYANIGNTVSVPSVPDGDPYILAVAVDSNAVAPTSALVDGGAAEFFNHFFASNTCTIWGGFASAGNSLTVSNTRANLSAARGTHYGVAHVLSGVSALLSSVVATATTTALSISAPDTPNSSLAVLVAVGAGTATYGMPAGWTSLYNAATESGARLLIATREVDGDPISATLTRPSAVAQGARILLFGGL